MYSVYIRNSSIDLQVITFNMTEELSSTYLIKGIALSQKQVKQDMIGQEVTFSVDNPQKYGKKSVITEWSDYYDNAEATYKYQFVLKSKFWYRAQERKYAIYQEKSITNIIQATLDNINITYKFNNIIYSNSFLLFINKR